MCKSCTPDFLGGPADGKLVPGDQFIRINNVSVDDLSREQAADIIRYVAWQCIWLGSRCPKQYLILTLKFKALRKYISNQKIGYLVM